MSTDAKDRSASPAGGEPQAQPDGEPRAEQAPRPERRSPSLRGFARRLLFDDPPAGHTNDGEWTGAESDQPVEEDHRRRIEARAVLAALLETGDKAKTETIRMVAREVRGYFDALDLHKDLNNLLTNYSLEVKASIHLAPLDQGATSADKQAAEADSGGKAKSVSVGLKARSPVDKTASPSAAHLGDRDSD